MKRIFLIGFMGAGKTTLGRVLAREMGLTFYDLDDYIVERFRKTIPAIFEESGEAGFREIVNTPACDAVQFVGVFNRLKWQSLKMWSYLAVEALRASLTIWTTSTCKVTPFISRQLQKC